MVIEEICEGAAIGERENVKRPKWSGPGWENKSRLKIVGRWERIGESEGERGLGGRKDAGSKEKIAAKKRAIGKKARRQAEVLRGQRRRRKGGSREDGRGSIGADNKQGEAVGEREAAK